MTISQNRRQRNSFAQRGLAIMAISTPVLLYIPGVLFYDIPLQPSFSAYYWTPMIWMFLTLMIIPGIFLISYKGYDRTDSWIANLAGVAVLSVAIFPTARLEGCGTLVQPFGSQMISTLHYGAAGVLFFAYALLFIWRFRLSNPDPSPEKKIRNRVFLGAALTILGTTIAIPFITNAIAPVCESVAPNIVFWLETVITIAIGVAWGTKGGIVLADSQPQEDQGQHSLLL